MADKITPSTREALECFARNGRWGTCVGCPRTATGHVFPEFCEWTKRYDHALTLEDVFEFVTRSRSKEDSHGR